MDEFAEKNPGVTVTTLRFCNVLGPGIETSHARLLSLPAVPMILGFDPRYQFIHSDDVVAALEFAVDDDLPAIYNAAPDGVLVLSEVIDLLGKRALPVLPPWGTGLAAAGAETVRIQDPARGAAAAALRARDRQPQAQGGRLQLRANTTREAVSAFAEYLRLRSVMGRMAEPYRYEKEVEDFLRRSPSVRQPLPPGRADALLPPAPRLRSTGPRGAPDGLISGRPACSTLCCILFGRPQCRVIQQTWCVRNMGWEATRRPPVSARSVTRTGTSRGSTAATAMAAAARSPPRRSA